LKIVLSCIDIQNRVISHVSGNHADGLQYVDFLLLLLNSDFNIWSLKSKFNIFNVHLKG